MKFSGRMFTIVLLVLALGIASGVQAAGNKKMMTVQAAKTLAERALVESVIGLKIKSESSVEDMVAASFRIESKTSANIKEIEYTDIVYDSQKDIAKVTAQVKLGSVITILGTKVSYPDKVVQRVAFATSTRENAAHLQALRAAELHAYEQLAKKLVGMHIDSDTTVQDFVLQNDSVKSDVMAAVFGARLVEYSWDADGNATVKLSIKADDVRDILGQHIVSDGPEITVEGTGAPYDELSESSQSGGMSAQIREESIDIPMGPSSASSSPEGGAADKH